MHQICLMLQWAKVEETTANAGDPTYPVSTFKEAFFSLHEFKY